MLRLGAEKDELNVVQDQSGIPTSTLDLARALITMIPQLNEANSGIYHYSNAGETSWYAFAKAIFELKNYKVKLNAVSSSEFPTAAKRPAYSVLNTSKIQVRFGITIRNWRDALAEDLQSIEVNI